MRNKATLYLILLLELLLFYLFRQNSDGEMPGNLFAGLILILLLFDGFIIALTLNRSVATRLAGVIEILSFLNLVAFGLFVAVPLLLMLLVRIA